MMKTRLLQLVTMMLIGVALGGCAGTGEKFASGSDAYYQAVGPWPAQTNDND